MKRAAFKGCVNYVMNKPDAKLISADGVLLDNVNSIIQSFQTQRLMKPKIKHPVGHISLSYSPDDEKRLTDGAMITLAKEYMQEMNITDTQYIIVRHFDNGNPHVHLVHNRIDNNGKVISDKNDRYRNEAICKKLKDKYGLTYGKSKDKVKQQKLRGKDKTKYQVHDGIKGALKRATDWNDLEELLKEKGIGIAYKYKGQTDEVQGISFTIDKITFKGSDIDRSFSYSKLDKLLQEKAQKQRKEQEQSQSTNQPSNQNINNNPKGIKR
ncbi:relaxase/mobilization nuclease domain-containing protein [uncultured Dysgonomonas sp.]|uniref:relaxase/mobilization nuclease domain-containing protein n=1 Tax=uncultured Dysgonomonas sp. TaxID=206096 RepID=UPI0028059DB1|nr:relaxase/mobilization nuclease domain-containing protein [uncultured Dysgonomonas sp.]